MKLGILYPPKSSQTSTIISANTHVEIHQKYVPPTSHDHLNQQKYFKSLIPTKQLGQAHFSEVNMIISDFRLTSVVYWYFSQHPGGRWQEGIELIQRLGQWNLKLDVVTWFQF